MMGLDRSSPFNSECIKIIVPTDRVCKSFWSRICPSLCCPGTSEPLIGQNSVSQIFVHAIAKKVWEGSDIIKRLHVAIQQNQSMFSPLVNHVHRLNRLLIVDFTVLVDTLLVNPDQRDAS